MATQSQEVDALIKTILSYFEQNPNAADSLEGIVKWWLGARGISVSEKSVLCALKHLCDNGLVVETQNQSGKSIYSSAKTIRK